MEETNISSPYLYSIPGPSSPKPSRYAVYATPAHRTYSDSDESSPQPYSLFLEDTFQYFSFIYAYLFQLVSSRKFFSSLNFPFTAPLLMRGTVSIHLTSLHFITLLVFRAEYILESSSLCNFLCPPLSASFLAPNILYGTLYSKHPQTTLSISSRDQVSHPFGLRNNSYFHAQLT